MKSIFIIILTDDLDRHKYPMFKVTTWHLTISNVFKVAASNYYLLFIHSLKHNLNLVFSDLDLGTMSLHITWPCKFCITSMNLESFSNTYL